MDEMEELALVEVEDSSSYLEQLDSEVSHLVGNSAYSQTIRE